MSKKDTLNYNNDTLKSSYEKLQEVMIELFLENWDDIKNNKIIPIKQDDSIKTIHYLKHRPSENLIMPNGWDTKILDLFKLYKNFNIKNNKTIIGKNYPTYIIAELSCNHNQIKSCSINRCNIKLVQMQ